MRSGTRGGCHSWEMICPLCSHEGILPATYSIPHSFQSLVSASFFPSCSSHVSPLPSCLFNVFFFFLFFFHFIKLLVCYCYQSSVRVGFFYKWSACLLNRNCVSLNSAALSCAVKALDCELLGVSNHWHRPQSCLESRAEVEPWDSKEPRSSAGWADNCAPQTSLERIRVERSLWTSGELNSDPSSISPSQELRLSK